MDLFDVGLICVESCCWGLTDGDFGMIFFGGREQLLLSKHRHVLYFLCSVLCTLCFLLLLWISSPRYLTFTKYVRYIYDETIFTRKFFFRLLATPGPSLLVGLMVQFVRIYCWGRTSAEAQLVHTLWYTHL